MFNRSFAAFETALSLTHWSTRHDVHAVGAQNMLRDNQELVKLDNASRSSGMVIRLKRCWNCRLASLRRPIREVYAWWRLQSKKLVCPAVTGWLFAINQKSPRISPQQNGFEMGSIGHVRLRLINVSTRLLAVYRGQSLPKLLIGFRSFSAGWTTIHRLD
ncbi:hypothetical protein BCR37DRAFT_230972 [Protomyces lactucae-debilis]|uniref:Uncharacterized protein n=1 Tax=Protomyces lactucae-debilis TaxID=2754530 RepID=A0A1Y2EQ98_PROLT|nr:uncharacterized protein BCR37DRAFT_230972 [Protomyces lactucae-debilis]ORY73702.1 hypothetical protein BCR37DRAFT_230972 [Protomyces lactucae-debilis]